MGLPTSASFVVAVAVAVVVVAACGGQIDEPAPRGTTGSNSPSSTPAATGCAGACDRFHECTKSYEDRDDCISSCGREVPDPARASVYGTCIQELSCEQIERGLGMNYGPIGACYAKAQRAKP